MERRTIFVQVIVPLSITGELTYRVPFEWNDLVKIGQRVIVQIGKKKLYTGIISEVHERVPDKYEVKYLEYLLDEFQVVYEHQINFWKWISEYYLCSLGEVMKCAVPNSMLLASETTIVLASEDRVDKESLDNKTFKIIEALEAKGSLTLAEISSILEIKTVMPVVNKLIKNGLVITSEELKERVKPKLKTYVTYTDYSAIEENRIEILNDLEKRAFKQLELFLAYLKLSEDEAGQVSKKELLDYAGVSTSVLKALVDKNILSEERKEISRFEPSTASVETYSLSHEQNKALQRIKEAFTKKNTCLFHGVTSSGKTEIYSELIESTISNGKSVLFLVPEIALTTQLIKRLKLRFGDTVGVFHSKFNQGERTEVWKESLKGGQGRFKIFIGARSALFLPLKDLGLIVVDEEHDSSYKQFDPAPRYNARDLALVLSGFHGCKTLLGSATPSIESYHNAKEGKYALVELMSRFGDVAMPEIKTVDLRKQVQSKVMEEEFSQVLLNEISQTIAKGEQVILFQNRRGYSPVWQCVTCGTVPECARCDVSLNYHKPIHALKCHYCGFTISPAPSECEVCTGKTFKMVGFGTQKLEEFLQEKFPEQVVQRMDFDTTRGKSSYLNIIEDLESGYTDILVGTQMVSKGLDFKNVGLVGVIQADHMLRYPDFRAFERSYQLMTQVAGRAGRREKKGAVLIQSYFPAHRIIQNVINHDYDDFFMTELEERRKYFYPPFSRIIVLTMKHRSIEELNDLSKELGYLLRQKFGDMILGPEFPAIIRIQNLYLKNIRVTFKRDYSPAKVKSELMEVINAFRAEKGAHRFRLKIDVDPQ